MWKAEGRSLTVEVGRSDHGRDARGTAGLICVARPSWPWVHGRDARGTAVALRGTRKKRVSKFDERSHYVIENKGSAKRTKPNKANFPSGGSPHAESV